MQKKKRFQFLLKGLITIYFFYVPRKFLYNWNKSYIWSLWCSCYSIITFYDTFNIFFYKKFCIFTLEHSEVCAQCPIWLFAVISWIHGFPVLCSGNLWMIFSWFLLPQIYWCHFCFYIPHALYYYCKEFTLQNLIQSFLNCISVSWNSNFY